MEKNLSLSTPRWVGIIPTFSPFSLLYAHLLTATSIHLSWFPFGCSFPFCSWHPRGFFSSTFVLYDSQTVHVRRRHLPKVQLTATSFCVFPYGILPIFASCSPLSCSVWRNGVEMYYTEPNWMQHGKNRFHFVQFLLEWLPEPFLTYQHQAAVL